MATLCTHWVVLLFLRALHLLKKSCNSTSLLKTEILLGNLQPGVIIVCGSLLLCVCRAVCKAARSGRGHVGASMLRAGSSYGLAGLVALLG